MGLNPLLRASNDREKETDVGKRPLGEAHPRAGATSGSVRPGPNLPWPRGYHLITPRRTARGGVVSGKKRRVKGDEEKKPNPPSNSTASPGGKRWGPYKMSFQSQRDRINLGGEKNNRRGGAAFLGFSEGIDLRCQKMENAVQTGGGQGTSNNNKVFKIAIAVTHGFLRPRPRKNWGVNGRDNERHPVGALKTLAPGKEQRLGSFPTGGKRPRIGDANGEKKRQKKKS